MSIDRVWVLSLKITLLYKVRVENDTAYRFSHSQIPRLPRYSALGPEMGLMTRMHLVAIIEKRILPWILWSKVLLSKKINKGYSFCLCFNLGQAMFLAPLLKALARSVPNVRFTSNFQISLSKVSCGAVLDWPTNLKGTFIAKTHDFSLSGLFSIVVYIRPLDTPQNIRLTHILGVCRQIPQPFRPDHKLMLNIPWPRECLVRRSIIPWPSPFKATGLV